MMLHPQREFQRTASDVEVRWDPLTGHSSRLVKNARFLAPTSFDLETLAGETREDCAFCPENVERVTPRWPPSIHADGRIRRGKAILFPNIVTYTQYSSVAIYGPELHFLPLDRMTPRIVADNLHTQVEFIAAVVRQDAGAAWASINANHMLPSGSSVFHPHTQGAVDRFPTTMQRLLADVEPSRFTAYLQAESAAAERYVGRLGEWQWHASFAPVGFMELRAFLPGVSSPAQLPSDQVEALGTGIALALNLYASRGFQSFNAALYGAPPALSGYPLNLRLVARSNLQPLYRADATYYERLHWQAMIDTPPEETAAWARSYFAAHA